MWCQSCNVDVLRNISESLIFLQESCFLRKQKKWLVVFAVVWYKNSIDSWNLLFFFKPQTGVVSEFRSTHVYAAELILLAALQWMSGRQSALQLSRIFSLHILAWGNGLFLYAWIQIRTQVLDGSATVYGLLLSVKWAHEFVNRLCISLPFILFIWHP